MTGDAAGVLDDVIAAYAALDDWSAPALKDALEAVGTARGLKLAKAQAPVRVATIGRTVGLPLFESLEVLGRERTLAPSAGSSWTALTGSSTSIPSSLAPTPSRPSPSCRPSRSCAAGGGRSGWSSGCWPSSGCWSPSTWRRCTACGRPGGPTRPGRWTPSWCSAPPSTTGGRRRSWRPDSTTPSTCTSAARPPRVFVTGGKQPLDRFTEAQSEARYLEDRGVPAAAILQEDQGRTSWESLTAVADQLTADGLHSVLLVSDPYHAERIKGMASELGLEAYVSSTRTSPVTGFAAFRHMLKEAAGVAAARVVGWDRLTSWTE